MLCGPLAFGICQDCEGVALPSADVLSAEVVASAFRKGREGNVTGERNGENAVTQEPPFERGHAAVSRTHLQRRKRCEHRCWMLRRRHC